MSQIESEIATRKEWTTVRDLAGDGCDPNDLKACTQECTRASSAVLTGNPGNARACVTMGDHWADGRAAGSPQPKAAQRSYHAACFLGDLLGCTKEAATWAGMEAKPVKAGWTEGQRMSFVLDASTCLRSPVEHSVPACLAAGEAIEKLQLPLSADPYLARWHIDRCELAESASCDWVTGHPSPEVDAYKAELRQLRTIATASAPSQSEATAQLDDALDARMEGLTHVLDETMTVSKYTNRQTMVPLKYTRKVKVVVLSPGGAQPEVYAHARCSGEGAPDTMVPITEGYGNAAAWGAAFDFPPDAAQICITILSSSEMTSEITLHVYEEQ